MPTCASTVCPSIDITTAARWRHSFGPAGPPSHCGDTTAGADAIHCPDQSAGNSPASSESAANPSLPGSAPVSVARNHPASTAATTRTITSMPPIAAAASPAVDPNECAQPHPQAPVLHDPRGTVPPVAICRSQTQIPRCFGTTPPAGCR